MIFWLVIGILIGTVVAAIIMFLLYANSYQAVLEIDESDGEVDRYGFIFLIPIDQIRLKKRINVKVKNVTDIVSKRSMDA